MRAYVITTGTIFGLIAAAHVARILDEGTRLLTEPFFMVLTLLAAGMAAWAWRVFQALPRA
jgi:hypothetical protein